MGYLRAIIEILIAIPKVFNLFKDLFGLYIKSQQAAEEKKRMQAIEEMKKATTVEEVKNANANITRNLP